ncbi:MAG: hypothetical protein QOH63_1983 [Acidobacteriota bacterium]|jgi:hypothetical protein|nr:hypothetical protein [Acidobacteriota bacterium]
MNGAGITASVARQMDKARRYAGPVGKLILLKYLSKDTQGAISYEVVKEYDLGWRANRIKGSDGAFYTVHEIADVDSTLEALFDSDDAATDYVIEGRVYKLEPDKITRPITEPKVWIFQGYDKNELYQ